MNHADYVDLIKSAIPYPPGTWADLGSGDGAFTFALADGAQGKIEIYSIDKDKNRLSHQKTAWKQTSLPGSLHFIHADFTTPLPIPLLDGILMANSLHFIQDKVKFLLAIKQYLKENGRLVVVEYNVDTGNQWVPYPLSYSSFSNLSKKTNYKNFTLLAKKPSGFLNEMYSVLMYP